MSSNSQVIPRFDIEATTIEFPAEGVSTTAKVTRLGRRLFRLESVPVFAEAASFGDVIEADPVTRGGLRFCRVVEPSNWHVFDFILSNDERASETLDDVLKRVDQLGGYWERVFGGCLFICLPPDVGWDPTAEVVG